MPGPGSFEEAYFWSQPWGDLWVASVGMTMYQPYWLLWVGNGRTVHRGGVSFFTMCFRDAEGRGFMGGMH